MVHHEGVTVRTCSKHLAYLHCDFTAANVRFRYVFGRNVAVLRREMPNFGGRARMVMGGEEERMPTGLNCTLDGFNRFLEIVFAK